MKVNIPFPNNLREIRFRKNVRQIDLAIKTRIYFSTLSRIEHGYLKPSPDQKKRLAKVLGCSVQEIFPKSQNEDANEKPIRKKRIEPVL